MPCKLFAVFPQRLINIIYKYYTYLTSSPCINYSSDIVAQFPLLLPLHGWYFGTFSCKILALALLFWFSGVASPKKVGGRTIFFCWWAVKSYNIHARKPPPPIYKTLLNGFARISGGVWTEVGGSGPSHSPPVATPLFWFLLYLYFGSFSTYFGSSSTYILVPPLLVLAPLLKFWFLNFLY